MFFQNQPPLPAMQPEAPIWAQAEDAMAQWVRSNGWPDAATTARGADGGVDIEAPGLVGQVKHHSKQVGSPAIQQLYGVAASRSAHPIFFSSAGYSSRAMAWAHENNVACVEFCFRTFAVKRWNRVADQLVRARTGYPPGPLAAPGGSTLGHGPVPSTNGARYGSAVEQAVLAIFGRSQTGAPAPSSRQARKRLIRIEQDLARLTSEAASLRGRRKLSRRQAKHLVSINKDLERLRAERRELS